MTNPRNEVPAFLDNDEALAWFGRTNGGLSILDNHFIALRERFGSNATWNVRAATDPLDGRPQTLVISVSASRLSEEEAYSNLVATQEDLLNQEAQLRERYEVDPYSRIVVTLDTDGETWSDFTNRIEEDL